jgi:hypothetical protein
MRRSSLEEWGLHFVTQRLLCQAVPWQGVGRARPGGRTVPDGRAQPQGSRGQEAGGRQKSLAGRRTALTWRRARLNCFPPTRLPRFLPAFRANTTFSDVTLDTSTMFRCTPTSQARPVLSEVAAKTGLVRFENHIRRWTGRYFCKIEILFNQRATILFLARSSGPTSDSEALQYPLHNREWNAQSCACLVAGFLHHPEDPLRVQFALLPSFLKYVPYFLYQSCWRTSVATAQAVNTCLRQLSRCHATTSSGASTLSSGRATQRPVGPAVRMPPHAHSLARPR